MEVSPAQGSNGPSIPSCCTSKKNYMNRATLEGKLAGAVKM